MTIGTMIYLLEDDPEVTKIISRALLKEGFEVSSFARCAAFLAGWKKHVPDLCLIDLGLPDGDGLHIIADTLRADHVPSIVVSGKADWADKTIALEIGADDYVTKPFEPRELIARIKALMRRVRITHSNLTKPKQEVAIFDQWEADFESCMLTAHDGTVQSLSVAESRLLYIFVKSAGRVLSRNTLMDHMHLSTNDPLDRSVDARISRLRRKLGDDTKSPNIIRTVYGAGYLFTSAVELAEAKIGSFS